MPNYFPNGRPWKFLVLDHDTVCQGGCSRDLKAGTGANWAKPSIVWCVSCPPPAAVDESYTEDPNAEDRWWARKFERDHEAFLKMQAERSAGRPESSGTAGESTSDKGANDPRNHQPTTPAATTSDPKYAEAF